MLGYLDAFNHNTTLAAGTYKDHQAHRLTAGYDANNLFVSVAGQYAKNWGNFG